MRAKSGESGKVFIESVKFYRVQRMGEWSYSLDEMDEIVFNTATEQNLIALFKSSCRSVLSIWIS